MADPKLPRGALAAAMEALEEAGGLPGAGTGVAKIALAAAFPVIQKAVLRDAARLILLLPGLASGNLCPECHGRYITRPDVPNPRFRSERFCCKKGHEWDKPSGPRISEESLLRMLARGEPLPSNGRMRA